MKTLEAHGRVADLCDANFKDWRLNIDAKHERLITSQPDWPCFAAAFASLSGGLEDLADDVDDNSLLELVRHGFGLFKMGIVSERQVVDARNMVMREVVMLGEAIEQQLDDVASNN